MHVPHGGCLGVGSVLLDLFHSEFGPGGEVAGAYGIDPSGEDWGEEGCVVECDAVSVAG